MLRNRRMSGILMPIFSLPSQYGIGTLGSESYKFVDFLHKTGSKIWQLLPLGVTSYGDSPYQSFSSKGLNYYFIDPLILVEKGLLNREECDSFFFEDNKRHIDYGALFNSRTKLLRLAFKRFNKESKEFKAFLKEGEYNDFSMYMTLKELNDFRPYYEWEKSISTYSPEIENKVRTMNEDIYLFYQWTQFEFLSQYMKLKRYANNKGILLVGDIPLYLSRDSVECYKYPELFQTDEKGDPTNVAGCPPDYFAPKGQLWGNPIYDWKKMETDGFKFFRERLDYNLKLFDILRIDHFRGLAAYYSIPFGDEDATGGEWVDGPGLPLFEGRLDYPIIAEDLGFMDDKVRKLLKDTSFPGMKILEFAFDGNPHNDHLPSNCTENFVSYTGTHDNMPIRGYLDTLDKEQTKVYAHVLEKECEKFGVPFIGETKLELAYTTVRISYSMKSFLNIIPMQDLVFFGNEARLNVPSVLSDKNWSFRFLEEDFKQETIDMVKLFNKEGRR